ncbi:hypothetical protein BDV93DRAFT_606080 [Ceratobasidium sp. AG-I]|nr:hypothetical protein BDV93DRAFT_606080 [Ceratobasidium sp. AG-I]
MSSTHPHVQTSTLPKTRGPPSSSIVETPASPYTHLAKFRCYTGAGSKEPCAKRALIISIEYLEEQKFLDGSSMSLTGSHSDADDILELLYQEFEYNRQDIRVLADIPGLPEYQMPTRENIISGLQWLSNGCRSGDRRFIHYSGHGTQAKDLNGDEEDGWDEALQPSDWATRYEHDDKGLIIDDELREQLVDRLPQGSTLTALFDSCHSGTILDMDDETQAIAPRFPMPRDSLPSVVSNIIPSITLGLKWPNFRRSSPHARGNNPMAGVHAPSTLAISPITTRGILIPPVERADSGDKLLSPMEYYNSPENIETPDFPATKEPGESLYTTLARKTKSAYERISLSRKPSRTTKKVYEPIAANVICWSACQDDQSAWTKLLNANKSRGILTSALTTGLRGAANDYEAVPGAFFPKRRVPTYAELYDYVVAQERQEYRKRKQGYSWARMFGYQDPQLWISATMGNILDQPAIL